MMLKQLGRFACQFLMGGCLLTVVASQAQADLIGLSSATASYYRIDPVTGAATFISTSDGNASFTGLSFIGTALYASDIFNEPGGSGSADVVRVNLPTGASTFVSNQGGSANWHGLASNQTAGLLYSIDLDDGNKLKTLDPISGTIVTIGSGTGIQGRGMDYADATGTLYATGPGAGVQSLFTVNTAIGTSTLIGSTGIDSFLVGLAFDETSSTLYMVADPDNFLAGSSNLYKLNLSTGAATLIGSTSVNAIDGLAWTGAVTSAVPEPSTVTLVGFGVLGLGILTAWRRTSCGRQR